MCVGVISFKFFTFNWDEKNRNRQYDNHALLQFVCYTVVSLHLRFFHQGSANSQGVTPHRQGYAMYKSLRSLLSLRRGVEVCGVTVGICDVRPR